MEGKGGGREESADPLELLADALGLAWRWLGQAGLPNSGLVVDKEVSLERWRGEERTSTKKIVQAHRDALELAGVDDLEGVAFLGNESRGGVSRSSELSLPPLGRTDGGAL